MSPSPRGSSPAARRALTAAVWAPPSTAAPAGPARPAGPPSGSPLAALVSVCDQDELVDLAISQGVAGRAAERLAPLLSAPRRGRLLAHVRQEALQHLSYLGLLERLGAALDDAGVAWAVLKGPVLAELSYRSTPRGYTDLDLLVAPGQLGTAIQVLERAGVTLAQGNWPMLVKDARGELTMGTSQGHWVDLHWSLFWKRNTRQRFLVPVAELLHRRRRAQLGMTTAWIFEPTDFAAHVALHACLSGGHELRWLLDVERTLAHETPDWDVFVRRCRAWRVGLPVSVALCRAHQAVGARVPAEVVQELGGGRVSRGLVDHLSSWATSGHMPGGRSVRTGLTRSLRDNPWATAAAFAAETGLAASDLLRLGPLEVADPRHPLHQSGGEAGLERYLRMVESTDAYGHLRRRELRRFLLPPA